MIKLKFMLLFTFTMLVNVAIAQEREVTGVVTSRDSGEPISFVTVLEIGTNNGVYTDGDGYFNIAVKDSLATLIFSSVGFKSIEVATKGTYVINIKMVSDVVTMDEVVVTALGISREKKSLGYSSQALTSEDVQKANSSNALSGLSGRVAGLQINGQNFAGSQNILIRGASSFSGNNQPLFVVDGVPLSNEGFNSTETQRGAGGYDYGSMISDLNPYDIESVDILKGSAASALYGARGQNGVIMITTKSGSSGVDKFSIEVNSGITFESVKSLPTLQNSYGGGYSTEFSTGAIDGVNYSVVEYIADESWGPKFDADKMVLHWWGVSDYEQGITTSPETAPWSASANGVDSFYETGVAYQNSINVISNSENSLVRFGYTNMDITGVMPNSKQSKNSYNLKVTTSLFDDIIDLNSSINFVNTVTKGRPHFGAGDSPSQALFQWGQRQLDMNRLKDYINPDGTQRAWNRKGLYDASPSYSDNPYWSVYKNWQDDDRVRLYGTVGLKSRLTANLSIEGNIYVDNYTFNTRERFAIGSQELSYYREVTRQATEINYEGKLSWHKRVDKFDIMGVLGANMRSNDNSLISGTTSGGLVIPDMWNLNNSTSQAILDDYDSEKLVKSQFSMVSVGWSSTLYIDGTYRIDYDSSLPTGNNSYGYFSLSGSFIATELFKLEGVDLLKARLNYGETGNGTDPYQVYNSYISDNPFNGTPIFSNSSNLNNSNLVPEKTKEVELGLEVSLFNRRAGFDLSLYNRTTSNQIVPMEISGAGGYTNMTVNAGAINNRGVELLLYGTPLDLSSFKWDITLNYAKNRNRVEDLSNGLDKIVIASSDYSGAVLNAEEGATFQELYGYDYMYDSSGNKIINPQTGFYEQGEFHSLGSVLPDYTAGINNHFRYKNLDLGVLIDTSQGGVYYSLSYVYGMYSGMQAATATPTSGGNTIREDGIVLDGVLVTDSGEDNGEQAVVKNDINISAKDYGHMHLNVFGTPSATAFFDASYIKLREVTLGYTLPQLTDKVKSIRVSVYGRNMAVWGLDRSGADPETIVGGNGNIQGIEAGVNPGTQSCGFNIEFSL